MVGGLIEVLLYVAMHRCLVCIHVYNIDSYAYTYLYITYTFTHGRICTSIYMLGCMYLYECVYILCIWDVCIWVVICTDLSGKEPYRQVGLNLDGIIICMQASNARHEGSSPALGAIFQDPIIPRTYVNMHAYVWYPKQRCQSRHAHLCWRAPLTSGSIPRERLVGTINTNGCVHSASGIHNIYIYIYASLCHYVDINIQNRLEPVWLPLLGWAPNHWFTYVYPLPPPLCEVR